MDNNKTEKPSKKNNDFQKKNTDLRLKNTSDVSKVGAYKNLENFTSEQLLLPSRYEGI